MITSGFDIGGPELDGTKFDQACRVTMQTLKRERDPDYNNGETPWVNTVFIVPGTISKPDFEGYQIGHYSKKQKGVVVMIAVPENVAAGHGIRDFIFDSLQKSSEIAFEFFTKKGETFPIDGAKALAVKVWKGLAECE